MKRRAYSYLIYIFTPFLCFNLLLTTCQTQTKDSTIENIYNEEIKKPTFVLLDQYGDTIPTGVPIPVAGKAVPLDKQAEPKIIPVTQEPTKISVPKKSVVAGEPEVHIIPQELTIITPGENGVPFPKTIPAVGKKVSGDFPQSYVAPAFTYKNDKAKKIKNLDTEIAIGTNSIKTIMEDSKGNIWFGTSRGAIRYDGRHFYWFTLNNDSKEYHVLGIVEDEQGDIWFATFGGGLTRYDGNQYTHFSKETGLSSDNFYCMLIDRDENLWLGSYDGGVMKYDGKKFTHYTEKEGLQTNSIYSILEDSKGNLWFGGVKNGVARFDGKQFTHYSQEEGLSNNLVYSIIEDKTGNIWIGTYDGLSCYDGKNFINYKQKQGLSGKMVRNFLLDNDGQIWMNCGFSAKISEGGLTVFDGKNFTYYEPQDGIASTKISALLEDSFGNIWIGSLGGVDRIDRTRFIHFSEQQGLQSEQNISSIVEDKSGTLWIGTWANGLIKYEDQAFHYYESNDYPYMRIINTILLDKNEGIWFDLGNHGAAQFKNQKFTSYWKTEEKHNLLHPILISKDDEKWFRSEEGIIRMDKEANQILYSYKAIGIDYVTAITEDSKGNIWFGTLLESVIKYDGEHLVFYTKDQGFKGGEIVNKIYEDRNENIWFATNTKGLICFDGTHFNHIDESKGLGSNRIYDLREDNAGNLWIGRYKGISVLIPQENWSKYQGIPSNKETTDENFHIINFGEQDGLIGKHYGALCLDQENQLWMGCSKGMTMIDLNSFEFPVSTPHVRLNNIHINNENIDFRMLADTAYQNKLVFGHRINHLSDSVASFHNYPVNPELPHDLNHLTFNFSAIDWAAPYKVQYSYFMKNVDDTWSLPQQETKVDYRNLSPGNYAFKVKAIGISKIWSEPFTYTFTILPPWWQTWWAYCLYGLIISSIIYSAFRFFLSRRLAQSEAKQLKELDQTKSRLYTNITHEFRTPLTVILGMAEQVRRNPRNWFVEGIELIKRNGNQLLHLVNQMLDLAKLESGAMPVTLEQGNIIQYLNYIVESFHSYAESQGIELHFLSDTAEIQMDYDAAKMLNILSNLLSNAVKFTSEGGNVYVIAEEKTMDELPYLQLKVKDSGMGIAEKKLDHIFDRFYQADDSTTRKGEGTGIGLALTKELVELLNGKIQVSSQPNLGTIFTIQLPITQTAPLVGDIPKDTFPQESNVYLPDAEESFLPIPAPLPDSHQPLLLLVEDNLDVVQYIAACLQDNYQLAAAQDGQQGIDKALELIPDLVISDVMMPKKDGFQLCETLKNDERTSHIPIIMLTAKVDVESRLAGLTRGADAYLAKPFHPEELQIRIEQLIQLRRQLHKRYQGQHPLEAAPNQDVQIEDEFMLRVRTIVEERLSDPNFKNPQLCRLLHMERTTVFRKLKALTGQSATAYIRSARLHKAKYLLEITDKPITEIADDVGFSDYSYFSRIYKREFGKNPTEDRKEM